MADFKIGTTLSGMTNIESLTTPLPVPRAVFRDYAEKVTAASGRTYGRGYPVCQWTFSLLTSAQRQQLRQFCPGASAAVYICTLANNDTYYNYQAVMHWPEEEERDPSKRRDRLELTILFTHLVAAT
ncbi:MAG: hypothetical protein WHV66_04975 [Anaerolineales bacterium]